MRPIEWVFSFHHKNQDNDYIQGWYCWPKWTHRWLHCPRWTGLGARRNPIYTIRLWVCGLLIGHQLSKTEWGYGGGQFIDGHCRWCDKLFAVTYEEARFVYPSFNEMRNTLPFRREDGEPAQTDKRLS